MKGVLDGQKRENEANEKGGMNDEEIKKFILTNVTKLFPDADDVNGSRVISNCGGPGRLNVRMLGRFKIDGIYNTSNHIL